MRPRHLPFILILIISGELYAEEKQCDFPAVENGRIAQYYYTFKSYYFPMSIDKKLSFFCLAGYATESGKQEEKIRCTAEGWSPKPRCYKKCLKPVLRNGYVSDGKVLYKIQENMRYGCTSGYKTTGGKDEEVVQCLSEGWSSQPSCRKEQETCLAPELHHGNYSTIQRTFKVKDRVQYTCTAGYYTATGKQTEEVECQAHGWSFTPQCNKLMCSSLRLIENGYFHPVKQTYEEGDVVQFFCHENYYLSGSDLIQCYNFGWYPESPICEGRRNRCPPPPVPLNSKVEPHSTTYRHGEVVHIECELNFAIQGSDALVCENGKWTEPPKCVENIENCKPPPVIANGAVVDDLLASYTTGSSVEYRCNEYYLLKGSQTSLCEQGTWSSPPVCLEPCTIDVHHMNRNNIQMKWKYEGKILHGDMIDFVCKQGYVLPLSTTLSEVSVQCNRGDVRYPVCVRRESKGMCASPPVIRNGNIVSLVASTYENGSSVEYQCFDSHFLQGSRDAYCVDGVWTTPPSCLEPCTLSFVEMDKNYLQLKWNFDNRPLILHGEYIEFICKGDAYMTETSIPESELRVQCDGGILKYPKCTPRERSLSFQEALRT
ncbi:coagulation factor XIII, beta subunit (predicted) [Rattus norvegicus]|uniref:Coagulation factor XIII, beta subunit (Predicted) n=1 Tax=Rattus norvegicus TaxID=10116 RepID=A6ICM7_RAT|nr:coagulation factor XIII, beta subunit (predicted) [Rattus norvegicus]|eukprot:NP_001099426.1 coagulation factor XIII B chain precursor [Rattus norvegicus]